MANVWKLFPVSGPSCGCCYKETLYTTQDLSNHQDRFFIINSVNDADGVALDELDPTYRTFVGRVFLAGKHIGDKTNDWIDANVNIHSFGAQDDRYFISCIPAFDFRDTVYPDFALDVCDDDYVVIFETIPCNLPDSESVYFLDNTNIYQFYPSINPALEVGSTPYLYRDQTEDYIDQETGLPANGYISYLIKDILTIQKELVNPEWENFGNLLDASSTVDVDNNPTTFCGMFQKIVDPPAEPVEQAYPVSFAVFADGYSEASKEEGAQILPTEYYDGEFGPYLLNVSSSSQRALGHMGLDTVPMFNNQANTASFGCGNYLVSWNLASFNATTETKLVDITDTLAPADFAYGTLADGMMWAYPKKANFNDDTNGFSQGTGISKGTIVFSVNSEDITKLQLQKKDNIDRIGLVGPTYEYPLYKNRDPNPLQVHRTTIQDLPLPELGENEARDMGYSTTNISVIRSETSQVKFASASWSGDVTAGVLSLSLDSSSTSFADDEGFVPQVDTQKFQLPRGYDYSIRWFVRADNNYIFKSKLIDTYTDDEFDGTKTWAGLHTIPHTWYKQAKGTDPAKFYWHYMKGFNRGYSIGSHIAKLSTLSFPNATRKIFEIQLEEDPTQTNELLDALQTEYLMSPISYLNAEEELKNIQIDVEIVAVQSDIQYETPIGMSVFKNIAEPAERSTEGAFANAFQFGSPSDDDSYFIDFGHIKSVNMPDSVQSVGSTPYGKYIVAPEGDYLIRWNVLSQNSALETALFVFDVNNPETPERVIYGTTVNTDRVLTYTRTRESDPAHTGGAGVITGYQSSYIDRATKQFDVSTEDARFQGQGISSGQYAFTVDENAGKYLMIGYRRPEGTATFRGSVPSLENDEVVIELIRTGQHTPEITFPEGDDVVTAIECEN